MENQEETMESSKIFSTSKLEDGNNTYISDADSSVSYRSFMAIGRGRMINYNAEY